MSNDAYPLAALYDRLIQASGYFDYPASARELVGLLGSSVSVVELCVGTGSLAIELERLGLIVVGIDQDASMLEQARRKCPPTSMIQFVEGSADCFSLGKQVDAVLVHSGHIIVTRDGGELMINFDSEEVLDRTLAAVAAHLSDGAFFAMNIEGWRDLTLTTADGSIYKRRILEESSAYQSRLHVYYDGPSGRLLELTKIRQPRSSLHAMNRHFESAGLKRRAQTAHWVTWARE